MLRGEGELENQLVVTAMNEHRDGAGTTAQPLFDGKRAGIAGVEYVVEAGPGGVDGRLVLRRKRLRE